MKRLLLIITIAAVTMGCYAANPQKYYKKLIEDHDVATEVLSLESPTPSTYWYAMTIFNEPLCKFQKDILKNKGAEKEALNNFSKIPRFYPRYSRIVDKGMQPYCDSLMRQMGVTPVADSCALYVIFDPKPAVFNIMLEKGVGICITSGLLNNPGLNRDMLMGMLAYGYANSVLQYQLRNLYQAARERRRDAWLAPLVATTLFVGTAALEVALDDFNYTHNPWGYTDNSITIVNNNVNIVESPSMPDTADNLYALIFGNKQVYESDMVAFRLMETMGKGNSYIEGLKLLGANNDSAYAGYPGHPSTPSRIALLNYMREHPEVTNTQNVKIRAKSQ